MIFDKVGHNFIQKLVCCDGIDKALTKNAPIDK